MPSKLSPQTVRFTLTGPDPAKIVTMLETTAHLMVKEGVKEVAGHHANWFKDTAGAVERAYET